MKRKLLESTCKLLLGLLIIIGPFSCKNLLEVEPENAVEPKQYYRDKFDADAAVMGIYGKFIGLADHYIVLNELRADLMDITPSADEDMVELNAHNVGIDNKFANPRPFYELIANCNDVLYNFNIMLKESKLEEEEYNQRYSDIAALRCWIYWQLAIHYGTVPYITEPLVEINDLKKLSGYPNLTLEEMLEKLISEMEGLPYKEIYTTTLNTQIDNYSTHKFFIHKNLFLGDLYLWKGEYYKAASIYKKVMEEPNLGSVANVDSYKIKYADVTSYNDLSVGYIRFADHDYYSLVDNNSQGWRSMFARSPDNIFNMEWIWWLPYDKNFAPKTPFVDLFSNIGGRYLVKPSQEAIDKWGSQLQRNGFTYDQRGKWSYRMVNGQPVIYKYLYNYDPLNPLEVTGKFFLARAALLHLRYSEAANRDKQSKIAYALLNYGMKTTFTNPKAVDIRTNFATLLPFPYDFDAREANGTQWGDFRDLWNRNTGIRGRAALNASTLDSAKYFDMVTKEVVDQNGLILDMENKLIEEAALELAYEGHRWQDLLRIAMRRNDPAFLANKIYNKLQKAGNPNAEAARAKLMDRNNWFLPFKIE